MEGMSENCKCVDCKYYNVTFEQNCNAEEGYMLTCLRIKIVDNPDLPRQQAENLEKRLFWEEGDLKVLGGGG